MFLFALCVPAYQEKCFLHFQQMMEMQVLIFMLKNKIIKKCIG
jgi:hypothetical protein